MFVGGLMYYLSYHMSLRFWFRVVMFATLST